MERVATQLANVKMDQFQNVATSQAAGGDSIQATGAIQVTSAAQTSTASGQVIQVAPGTLMGQQVMVQTIPQNQTIQIQGQAGAQQIQQIQFIPIG